MTEDKLEAQGMSLEQLFSRKLKSTREVSREELQNIQPVVSSIQ